MRSALPLLLCATALTADEPAGKWNMGLQAFGPTLTGVFHGLVDGQMIDFDIEKDLRLTKDKATPGIFLEYQGRRFGLALSADGQDYQGHAVLTRPVNLGGTTYPATFTVDSKLQLKSYELNWTIRAFVWEYAWIGVDLGLHGWNMDLSASGTGPDPNTGQTVTRTSSEQVPVPIPQIGLSAGGRALGDRLVFRASYHLLSRNGASYRRTQGDVRFFPLSWLGVRAFVDNETFDVPKGSVQDDLRLDLTRSGAGFGVVFRF